MDFRERFRLFFQIEETKKLINYFDTNVPSASNPTLNYFGVNFNKEHLSSIKLYYAFFSQSAISFAKGILPRLDEFEKYYPSFRQSDVLDLQNTGCTFTFKANSNFDLTRGFGFRFPLGLKAPFVEPRFIKLTEKDQMNYQGICFEYSGINTVKRRYYYYITDAITIKKIAEEWGNKNILNAELIEYTESESERKIILWGHNMNNQSKKEIVSFSDRHREFNEWMHADFGLKNLIDGEYLNKAEKASYFHLFNKAVTFPYDFKTNDSIDTIKYLLEKISEK